MAVTPKIIIIDKATGAQAGVAGLEVNLAGRQSIVELAIPRANIKTLARHGADMVITTEDGQTIVVHGYFAVPQNALVIQDSGTLWAGDVSSLGAQAGDGSINPAAASDVFTPVSSIGTLLEPSGAAASAGAAPSWLPLALAGIGIAAGASGGSSDSGSSDASTPQISPPVVSNVTQNANGTLTVSGVAHPNDTVTVTWPDNSTRTGTADAGGHYAVTSTGAQGAGTVSVVDTDASGHGSAPATHAWTAPAPPQVDTVTANGDGTVTVAGTAQADSTVTVTFADGQTATATAGADGHYSATSGTPETSATPVTSVTSTDAAGNTSAGADAIPTLISVPPPAESAPSTGPSGMDNGSGSDQTTSGDNGSTSTGSGTHQTTGGNNGSTGTGSNTPPPTPVAGAMVVHDDGSLTVTGSAQAGTTVTVIWPDGTTNSTTVDANGHWSASSASDQAQPSGPITAIDTDTAGNASAPFMISYSLPPLPPPSVDALTPNADGTLTLTGHAQAGGTVTVTYGDGSTASAAVDPSGHYSVTSATPQTSGEVSVTQSDASGHTSLANAIIYTDITPPLAPTVAPMSFNDDGSLTLAGTGEPGSTIAVTWPDGSISQAVVAPDGSYSLISGTLQPLGAITVIDIDQAHNTSVATVVDFHFHTGLPVITLTIDALQPDTGASATDFITSAPAITVSGTLTQPLPDPSTGTVDSVGITLVDAAGKAVDSGPATVNGATWTYAMPSDLPDGTYTVEASVYRHYVPTSPGQMVPDLVWTIECATKTVVIDTTAPAETLTISTPDSNGAFFSGTVSSPPADGSQPGVSAETVQISWDGGQTWHNAAWEYDLVMFPLAAGAADAPLPERAIWSYHNTDSPLPPGDYTLQVRVADAAGNVGQPVSQEFAIVPSTPPLPALMVMPPYTIGSEGSLIVSGLATVGSTVTVTFPDGSTGLVTTTPDAYGNWSVISGPSEPSGTVTISAIAPSGHASEKFIYPYTPTPAISAFTSNADGTLTVTGTAEAGNTVTVYFPDGSTATVVAAADGSYSLTSAAPETLGSVTLVATDPTGHTSVPVAGGNGGSPLVTAIHFDGSLTVSNTGEPGSIITVKWPDGSSGVATISADGSYSITSAAGVIQPSGAITVTNTDAAGHSVSAPATALYLAGFGAPGISIKEPIHNPDGTLIAAGTGIPGETVTVIFPDSSSATATVNAGGGYMVTSDTPQPSGVVSVTNTNAAGHVSGSVYISYTAESALPAPEISAVTYNPDLTLTVTGTATPGDTVTVIFPGSGETGTATAAADGSYSITSAATVGAGTVQVTATGTAGHVSAPVQAEQNPVVTAVTAHPDGTVTVAGFAHANTDSLVTVTFADGTTASARLSESGGGFNITSSTPESGLMTITCASAWGVSPQLSMQPVVTHALMTDAASGTAAPGWAVTVTFADGSTAMTTAGADGNYSVVSATPESGPVTVTAFDPVVYGPFSAGVPVTPGVLSVTSHADGTVTVSGFGAVPGGELVTVTFADGSTATCASGWTGLFSVTSSTQESVNSSISVTATNAWGVSPPSAPMHLAESITHNDDGTLTVSGTTLPGMVIVTFGDSSSATGETDGCGHYSLTSSTPETVLASVAAVGYPVHTGLVSCGLVPPAIEAAVQNADGLHPTPTINAISPDTGASSTDFVTSAGHLAVSGANSPLAAGETVQVNLGDGQGWHTATSVSGSQWSLDNTANALPDGLYVVQAHVANAAGNPVGPTAAQQVEVSASGTLNLSLADVLTDASALTSAGSTQQQVAINNDGTVSTVHLAEGVGTGATQWQDTGTATVNGVLYDVYHNTSQGASTAADLLIQQGISVI